MKPEPLHCKTRWLRDYDLVRMKEDIKVAVFKGVDANDGVFQARDVESAVAWLKEKIFELPARCQECDNCRFDEINDLIDDAFPDLKEGGGKP